MVAASSLITLPQPDGVFTDEHASLALLARRDATVATPTDTLPAPPDREPLIISGTSGPGMQVTLTVAGDPAWAAWRLAAVLSPTALYLQAATLVDGTPVYPAGSPPPALPSSSHRLVLVLRPRSGCARVDGATAADVLARFRRELEDLGPAWARP